MNRHLYRAEHWLRRNLGRWLPAALVLGLVLACAAHQRDTPTDYAAPSAVRG